MLNDGLGSRCTRPRSVLSLAKKPSGSNAFEISEIQEEKTDAGLRTAQDVTM
jgi:hypothetical protein